MRRGPKNKAPEEKRTKHYQVYFTDDELKAVWEIANYFQSGSSVITRKIINRFVEEWKEMTKEEKIGLWMKY